MRLHERLYVAYPCFESWSDKKEWEMPMNRNTTAAHQFRTVGGICNNLDLPLMEAANTPFASLKPSEPHIDGEVDVANVDRERNLLRYSDVHRLVLFEL